MTRNFKRIKEIGKGGMATVYLARDTDTNRLVAIKVLKTTVTSDKDYIKRFFREARFTAQLDHPNILLTRELEPKLSDPRGDIYSIGVILYQLITGRKPMGAFPPPQKLCPSIPGQLDDIVMKCLQPLPVGRYKNAYNLSLEIEAVLGKIKSKKAYPFLIELLIDPYYNKFAAEVIGNIGCTEPEAEEKLFKILLTHSETAYIALIPLGKLNSVKSIDLIGKYLANRCEWIREMALDALAMINEKERAFIQRILPKKTPMPISGPKQKKYYGG